MIFNSNPNLPQTKFSPDLPGKIKKYIFGPLSSVGTHGQLMAHMIKDNISQKARLRLDLTNSGEENKPIMADDSVLFEINKGIPGQGKFSQVSFHPGYISLKYGNNKRCCMGMCMNCCLVESHDTVVPRFQVTSIESYESTCCCALCCAKENDITLYTQVRCQT